MSLYKIGAHNVYYVKYTRTFKRHVKAAVFTVCQCLAFTLATYTGGGQT
ncbi:hypothetical protein YT52_001342 [Salmonella enterica subsp. enterica]|nr:hypothetical protein [Salmonella enterica subsp. enterica serovar Bonariensis]